MIINFRKLLGFGVGVLLAFTLLFISGFSLASSVTPDILSLSEALENLADRSSLVVAGTVTKLSSRYVPSSVTTLPSRYSLILTDVTIKPISFFKGKSQESITVVIPGGCIRKDNICFSTDFLPTFKTGEQVWLFLGKGEDGTWILSDYFYSKQPYSEGSSSPLKFDKMASQEHLPPEGLSKTEADEKTSSVASGGCSLLP